MEKPHSKVTVAVPGRTPVGFVHPDGIAWLSKNQNTGSSVQLLGAPKDGADIVVYVDTADLGDAQPAAAVEAIDINPADLRIETWRPNRGGWSTKPDNCCRLTHVPSGITVTVEGDDDARSVHAAKVIAMQKLELALATRAQHGQPIVTDVHHEVDDWLHSFVDQLADYVGACVDQSKPDATVETVGRARPMYQKLYGQVRAAAVSLFAIRQRALPELTQLQGAVAAAAHKLREAGHTALALRLEESAAGVELVLQDPQAGK